MLMLMVDTPDLVIWMLMLLLPLLLLALHLPMTCARRRPLVLVPGIFEPARLGIFVLLVVRRLARVQLLGGSFLRSLVARRAAALKEVRVQAL